jgi:hypothetical protein
MKANVAGKARARAGRMFLELNHDPSRSALVLGSGRGGTTWLAESIARQCRSRLLFEPFHPLWGPVRGEMRLFAHPSDGDPALARAVRRVLSGRVRTAHIEGAFVRMPRSRVVKDVHAANLLPWFRANYPALPVVFVVRHPIATALSRLNSPSFYGLGAHLETPGGRRDAERSPVAAWLPLYDRHREHGERLVGLVAEWCVENVYPLSRSGDGGTALAFYETAVLDPLAELARLADFCRDALGSAGDAPLTIGEARRPSAMDWFGTATEAHRSGEWKRVLNRWRDEVPKPLADRCLSVLADFGLDGLYGEDSMPREGDLALPRGEEG